MGSWHGDWFLNFENGTERCQPLVAWDVDSVSLWNVRGPWSGTTSTRTKQSPNG